MANKNLKKYYLIKFFIFISLTLIILNPYSVYGKPGQLIAVGLAGYACFYGIKKALWHEMLLPLTFLFFISIVGLISSIANGITQFNHIGSIISLIVVVLSVQGIWLIGSKIELSINSLIKIILAIIVLNSSIIILELIVDEFRAVVESFLDPLVDASINYADGYKFRGIASAGGANLSIIIPAGVICALYLFSREKIGVIVLIFIFTILFFSITVMGRSGLIFSVIPLALYPILNRRKLNRRSLFSLSIIGIALVASLLFLKNYGVTFLSDKFGDDFLFYSFGFIFEGKEGFEEEGTLGILGDFLTVLPNDFSSALFGYGFYGGSEFSPWTDSGYARMFLSVGYFFGALFYFVVIRLYLSKAKLDLFLVYSFVLVLSVAEVKESLLFSGYAARVFIIILTFFTLERSRFESVAHYHRT